MDSAIDPVKKYGNSSYTTKNTNHRKNIRNGKNYSNDAKTSKNAVKL